MARPVQIDRDKAFRNAADLFWQRGYLTTSLADLESATGMGKSSFYAAFGSKQALFEAVVDNYHHRSEALIRDINASYTGLAALRAFIDQTLLQVGTRKRRYGCLLVNSVIELEGVEPTLYRRASEHLQKLEITCQRWLAAAAEEGALNTALNVEELSRLTASLLHGLRVDSRLGHSPEQLTARVGAFFTLISTSPQSGARS